MKINPDQIVFPHAAGDGLTIRAYIATKPLQGYLAQSADPEDSKPESEYGKSQIACCKLSRISAGE